MSTVLITLRDGETIKAPLSDFNVHAYSLRTDGAIRIITAAEVASLVLAPETENATDGGGTGGKPEPEPTE